MNKVRLDVLLVERGLFPSREAARRAIMAGKVQRNHEIMDKPGTFVHSDDAFDVAQPSHPYVSRGGLKLERAIHQFGVDFLRRIVVDVGASTGGFTDCALQHGANMVYAVDVGYGQLDWKIRQDPRVVVMERTNFRYIENHQFPTLPDIAVMDVSFISTRLLLPKLQALLAPPQDIISLIKPQFEAGRGKVGKGGIVRDRQIHIEVLEEMLRFAYEAGLGCLGLDFSPIAGGNGNIEYLAWWRNHPELAPTLTDWLTKVPDIVDDAWKEITGDLAN